MSRPLADFQPAGEKAGSTAAQSTADTTAASPSSAAQSSKSAASATPIILVAPPSFAASAQELVAAALRNAKEVGLDLQGGALVVSNTAGDPFMAVRTRAIIEALKASGVAPINEARFVKELDAGDKAVADQLEGNPKVGLVFANDHVSALAVRQNVQARAGRRPIVVACYATEDQVTDLTRSVNVAALAEFTPQRLVRKAITTAVSLSQGKDVPPRVEQPVTVHDLPTNARSLKAQLAQQREREGAKSK
jgi:hypothetical protein